MKRLIENRLIQNRLKRIKKSMLILANTENSTIFAQQLRAVVT